AAVALWIVAHPQISGEQHDFLPVGVHERCTRVESGWKTQQTGAKSTARVLIERAGEDLLACTASRFIPGRQLPARGEIDAGELLMVFVERHRDDYKARAGWAVPGQDARARILAAGARARARPGQVRRCRRR